MRIKKKCITSTAINRNLHLSILLTSCIASIDCEGRAKDSGKLNRSDVFVVKDLAIQKVMKINSIQELGDQFNTRIGHLCKMYRSNKKKPWYIGFYFSVKKRLNNVVTWQSSIALIIPALLFPNTPSCAAFCSRAATHNGAVTRSCAATCSWAASPSHAVSCCDF